SKGLDLSPASAELSMLFGDGAGAFVIDRERRLMSEGGRAREARPYYLAVEDVLIETDGSFAEELMVRAPGTANGARWLDESHAASKLQYGRMQGRTVILQAVRKLADASARVLERNDVTLDQVGVLIPHQANRNLLAALAKRLAVPEERIIMNVDRFGNTSGASAFIALWQAVKEERLVPGSFALILAFGAGFTWGAALCRVQKAD
ncbi:MAG TPA: 3-oxoacyl-[acyl-carrier-protein] synthase III C-terminal domain-containing protein, partial [Blastocatellia bacterium]|nr:3-oxoacyl-[acyl-carrier-protein] synthase III C-terminal domain-containing protein [Blastocatellia bacterium]